MAKALMNTIMVTRFRFRVQTCSAPVSQSLLKVVASAVEQIL
jgi:hypothetical protein